MPVFLTDHDCSGSEQLATFAITDPSLRPGVLLRRTGPFEHLGVTIEHGRMLVCEYGRERRRVLAAVTVAGPPANAQLHLRVRAHGGRLQATVWRAGNSEPHPQLAVPVPAGSGGCGVLLVHPTSLRPCRLRLSQYALGSDDAFAWTPAADARSRGSGARCRPGRRSSGARIRRSRARGSGQPPT
jgi:hypothetical protein